MGEGEGDGEGEGEEGEIEDGGEGEASWMSNLPPSVHDPKRHRQPNDSFPSRRDRVASSLGFSLNASKKARKFHYHQPHVTRFCLRVWMQYVFRQAGCKPSVAFHRQHAHK